MGFGDFSFEELIERFSLTVRSVELFPEIPTLEPDPWLIDALERHRNFALVSEKSRCEFIVAPILANAVSLLGSDYFLYSGISLNIDALIGLKGECDFIVAKSQVTVALLTPPLLVVIEAKRDDFDEGIPQCAAQLVAAQRFNAKRREGHRPIFGCVTTGTEWQFLRLHETELLLDRERVPLASLDRIRGILVAIAR
jgi:hypothetical protein